METTKQYRRPTLAKFSPSLLTVARALMRDDRTATEISALLNDLGVVYPTPKGTRWSPRRALRLMITAADNDERTA